MKIAEKERYVDVTKEWLDNATPNSHKIKDCFNYEQNGIIYKVDGKNVILDYSEKELEVAHFLKKTFGGEIFMIPKINKPDGIKTPDYIFKKQKFDLKEIKGNSTRCVDDALKNKKLQANNFILDISKTKLSINEILKQVENLYHSPQRNWIKIIIIKKHNKLIAIFNRI